MSVSPLMAMCGRPRIGKGFHSGDASWSGAAMCPACLCDTAIAGPNAIRGSGPNYKHELSGPLAETGLPNPRCSTGLALSHVHPAKCVASSTLSFGRRWLAIGLAIGQQRPGGSRILVGQRHGGDLGWLSIHGIGQPRVVLEVCLSSVPDHRHGAGDQQPSEKFISLLGDPSHAFLAAGRVLFGNQTDPGGQPATGF